MPVGAPVEFVLEDRRRDPQLLGAEPRRQARHDSGPRQHAIGSRADRPASIAASAPNIAARQHALMAFYVVAHERRTNSTPGRARRASRRRPPDAAARARGRTLFLANGCGACHTVRGTAATARSGPDLTHVGSRAVASRAGTFPNNAGTLAGWIATAQHLKPGNLMPSFAQSRRRGAARASPPIWRACK